MMTGEPCGVGHAGSRGAVDVKGWLKALEADPKERYTAVADAQRMTASLMKPIRDREQWVGAAREHVGDSARHSKYPR